MSHDERTAPGAAHVHAKALSINLDPSIYGTFAEIGAGQEVARWFLRVGAASGTVAQTISAYDKTYSDVTYGAGTRYVSRERLLAMLEREYRDLLARLGPSRSAGSRFFAFADTVSARNYKGDNEQHGWVGIRFQAEPGAAASDVRLHVNLMDPSAELQQEALGILGVNLIDAAYRRRGSADEFLEGLFAGLSVERLEIDVIELDGPAFARADARVWCLRALRRGLAHAVVFDAAPRVVEPSSLLRKRPLVVLRGRFETLEAFHGEMLRASTEQLISEGHVAELPVTPVVEMTIHPAGDAPTGTDEETLARVERSVKLGVVVVSDYAEAFRLVQYLKRHTAEPLRLALGTALLVQLLNERFYGALPGTLLEGLGRLLEENVRIYVFPMPAAAFRKALGADAAGTLAAPPGSGRVGAADVRPRPPLDHLYRYLRAAGWIVALDSGERPG